MSCVSVATRGSVFALRVSGLKTLCLPIPNITVRVLTIMASTDRGGPGINKTDLIKLAPQVTRDYDYKPADVDWIFLGLST